MLNLRQIHKPTSLQEAIRLLQEPGTVALAGGSGLQASASRDVQAVVDLSGLNLSYVREDHGAIAIGATTTLAELDASPILRAIASGTVAQAAHRSASSILRNQATLGGTIVVDPDGILAVALLALDARVSIVRKDTRTIAFADFLTMREHLLNMALLTEVTLPMANPRASLQTVARTPSDRPIVSAAAAARIENRVIHDVRIALGGVAGNAVRATRVEQALEGQALDAAVIDRASASAAIDLAPQGDFRGSAEYRRQMAAVLTRRALMEL